MEWNDRPYSVCTSRSKAYLSDLKSHSPRVGGKSIVIAWARHQGLFERVRPMSKRYSATRGWRKGFACEVSEYDAEATVRVALIRM